MFLPLKFVTYFVTYFAGFLLCLNAQRLGEYLKVIDHPDSDSKRHGNPTPAVGGVCILIPMLLWIVLSLLSQRQSGGELLTAIGLGGSGVGLVGLMDDQSSTTPLSRILSILVFLAVTLIVDPALVPTTLNWSSGPPTAVSSWLYWTLMAVASVGIVNAVNMADGQNGLVPGMFVIWSICLMAIGDETASALAGVLLVIGTMVFVFNLRGKLFLGDCGSYGVTFALCALMVAAHSQCRVYVETIIAYFAVPMLDCLWLLVVRLTQKRSPAMRDNNHLHHHLEKRLGWRDGLAVYLGMVASTSLVATLEPKYALSCVLFSASVYFSFRWYLALEPLLALKANGSGPYDDVMTATLEARVVQFHQIDSTMTSVRTSPVEADRGRRSSSNTSASAAG